MRAQATLDAMLLDAVVEKGTVAIESRLSQRLAAADRPYSLSGLSIVETRDAVTISAQASFTFDPIFPDTFSLGEQTMKVASTVEASRKISSVKFQPLYAKGGYPKKVELLVMRTSADTVPELISTMYYKVDSATQICETNGNIGSDQCGEIFLGQYHRAYLRFSVWESGSHVKLNGPSPSTVILSDDKANSYRFVIDGVQQKNGKTVDVFGELDCDQSAVHEWEDMKQFLSSDSRDFRYKVTGYCDDSIFDILKTRIVG